MCPICVHSGAYLKSYCMTYIITNSRHQGISSRFGGTIHKLLTMSTKLSNVMIFDNVFNFRVFSRVSHNFPLSESKFGWVKKLGV